MKSIMKKLMMLMMGLVVGILLMSVGNVEAYTDSISTNNATALTVIIFPRADRGVEISSGEATLDLGVMDMNASTKTVHPATITVVGTMSSTELEMTSTITAVGLLSWNFDDDPLSANADLLSTWAVFTQTSVSDAPADNTFEVSNATITQAMVSVAERIGGSGGNGTRFESGADMDQMPIGTKRHLWIRMKTPSSTSYSGQQDVNFTMAVTETNY
jgi:hypothetical protein